MEYKTIFSRNEINKKIKIFFSAGISDKAKKIKNITIWQENILSGKFLQAKEEELQSLFLLNFFGEVLDYEYENPNQWNLKIENKTVFDNTKSDGALGFFRMKNQKETLKDVRVIIELKNARTTLDKPQNRKNFKGTPIEQAFMYAHKVGEKCKWIIVSNFLEIRLYQANDINKYEKFDLFSLNDENEFKRFYYLLGNGQLYQKSIASTVDNLLQTRIENEKKIGQEFYSFYKYIREQFFYHLKTHNKSISYLNLLQYAQTIIDRIVFISVIKDYDLISYNVLQNIEKIASESWEKDGQELWRQIKKLFKALNEGFPPRIHQFNGGLFKENKKINDLIIKDYILKKLLQLASYDFESDLSINILGHIFEQSITDIEKIKKDIAENKIQEQKENLEDFDKTKIIERTGKRKKDGIFYTPEHITKYIIDKSIGQWLDNEKEKIGINAINSQTKNNNELKLWEKYTKVLKSIKILDPACGSGAFLTQAFDYLYNEWNIVISEINKIKGILPTPKKKGQIYFENNNNTNFSDWKIRKQIVSNNLFGVDINHESVEITKLGLWLKTANKNDSLATLDTNIKIGNSIIDNNKITKLAFNWNNEFSEIMQGGGFDIIIGNPPYIVIKGGRFLSGYQYSDDEINYIRETYKASQQQINTYTLFVEKSIALMSKKGYLSFIIPNTFLANEYSKKFREFILSETHIFDIYNIGSAFTDANVETLILTLNHQKNRKTFIKHEKIEKNIDFSEIIKLTPDKKFLLNVNEENLPIILKMRKHQPLSDFAKVTMGISTGNNSKYISDKAINSKYKKVVTGSDISKYYLKKTSKYVYYDKKLLDRSRDENNFTVSEKLISKFVGTKLTFCYDNQQNYVLNSGCTLIILDNSIDIKYLLALLNSNLLNFYFTTIFTDYRNTFPIMKSGNIEQLPIPKVSKNIQSKFAEKANQLLSLYSKINKLETDFIDLMKSQLKVGKITTKLDNWYELQWENFSDELKKTKIKLSLQEIKEWRTFFINEQDVIKKIISQINTTNIEIDNMVYKLYGINKYNYT